MKSKRIVVLTGAGISAESGLSTFRDLGGLWDGFDVSEVASIEGWLKDPKKVLDFYNRRRKQTKEAIPNIAHHYLARLEENFELTIITQNVDDLHERAGSTKVIHLHGELTKARSEDFTDQVYDIGYSDIHLGDLSVTGCQLRPAIVWFGEDVPLIGKAIEVISKADIVIVVGTSLLVYPAAGLVEYVSKQCTKFIIDPNIPKIPYLENWISIASPATVGVKEVVKIIEKNLSHE